MDSIDRALLNAMQEGLPVCAEPYADLAQQLNISQQQIVDRVQAMLEDKRLSRFGPMYRADSMGGVVTLAAMSVATADFEYVAHIVNAFDEVAHNYARAHEFNMWFVVAAESDTQIEQVLRTIEARSGYRVYDMPKEEEYFIGLRFAL